MARGGALLSFVVVCCVVSFACAYSVAVLGGGVAGLTAAHELVERGFDVQVYDRQDVFGGKARSYEVPNTGIGGRNNLPGEHGFRIFWNYYRNVFDTLSRIPYNETITVLDCIIHYMERIQANELLTENGPNIYIDFGPENWRQWFEEFRNLSTEFHYLSKEEMDFTLDRMQIMVTTCEERMRDEFEGYSFGQFIGSQYRSQNFTKFFLGLMHLGGIDPNDAGLGPTVNYVQSLNAPWDEDIHISVLHRPTNEAWINPWVKYMTTKGATFYNSAVVDSFNCTGNKVSLVNVIDLTTGKVMPVKADYYIFAVPVDRMRAILQKSGTCNVQSLAGITKLPTTWMNGMQYFLHKDVQITDGFALYLDSEWKLSSVSLAQWWPEYDWQNYGDGSVTGVLSAIISNFTTPGILFNKTALQSSLSEIQQEVWAQIKAHVNKNGQVILTDSNVAGFSLDTSLSYLLRPIAPPPSTIHHYSSIIFDSSYIC